MVSATTFLMYGGTLEGLECSLVFLFLSSCLIGAMETFLFMFYVVRLFGAAKISVSL